MNIKNTKQISRRKFLAMTAGAASLAVIPLNNAFAADPKKVKPKKPNSKFGGVQVGAITYSWRSMSPTAEETLDYCLQCGISSIELMSNTIELYAGAPQPPARIPRDASEEQKVQFQKESQDAAEALKKWRSNVKTYFTYSVGNGCTTDSLWRSRHPNDKSS